MPSWEGGGFITAASEQKELFENFENQEEKVIGEGRHEELHALLEKFRDKYLK